MKGIDKLIEHMVNVEEHCPRTYNLKDVNFESSAIASCDCKYEYYLYSEKGRIEACQDCWRKSLETEYEEGE